MAGIRNTKAAAGPDIEGLAKFVREGDRTQPVHFAGREAEIDAVEALLAGAKEGKAGQTQVISAAPGAGKTALLRELQGRWKKSGQARGVYLEASAFADPARVIQRMFLALGDPAAERFGAVETETETQHAEVGVSAVVEAKAGGASGRATQRTVRPASFEEAFGQMEDCKTPVVLLVDEAQTWEGDQGRQISSLLVEAHVNADWLPLLIVAAGLGDAREVIARRGASKLKTEKKPMVLGRLSREEMGEVCGKFFDRYGIAGSKEQRTEWTQAITAGTDGWPRHLTNALRGAAEALMEGVGDLACASLADARAAAEAYRQQYYYDQIGPFWSMPELLAAVIAELPEDAWVSRAALRKAITRAYDGAPDLTREMPIDDVFANLLHKGLIQDFGQARYACPIPSFRTYVEAFCVAQGVVPVEQGPAAALLRTPGS